MSGTALHHAEPESDVRPYPGPMSSPATPVRDVRLALMGTALALGVVAVCSQTLTYLPLVDFRLPSVHAWAWTALAETVATRSDVGSSLFLLTVTGVPLAVLGMTVGGSLVQPAAPRQASEPTPSPQPMKEVA